MNRQIWIHSDDRKFQTILWLTNPAETVKSFELQTLTYGMSSAPYLATRVLKQIAIDNRDQYPRASSIIERDMYMDDLLSGANTVEEAIQLGREVSNIMKKSGMFLQKWASNSTEFLSHGTQIDAEVEEIAAKSLDEYPDNVKILGLQWLPIKDAFTYQVRLNPNPSLTKRAILSEASRIFDPLGLISPFVIKIKCMFQELWLLHLTWDDPLPKRQMEKWLNIRQEINDVSEITIPRWLNSTESKFQLHGFCDASEVAYAAVVYLRSHANGVTTTKIITAKTKVAPIKNVSLPRLELNGALLLAKLVGKIKSVLDISEPHIFIWTDSTIVLDWLAAPPRKWKTYIANRTSQILELTEKICWRHVSSQQNPADCATRGLSPQELKKTLMVEWPRVSQV